MNIPPTNFELEDSDTRTAIIHLNQKLKSLQEDVANQLAVLDACDDTEPKKQLSTLANEVERALQGIDEVVHMVEEET